jgi:hypothetical protein
MTGVTTETASFSSAELMHIRRALLKAPLPFEETYPVLMRIESIITGLTTKPAEAETPK